MLPHAAMRILQELAASEEMELAMLNNEARELNDYRIEQFELGRYFDSFFSSCYVGLRKPDPKFFELALDVLQRDARGSGFYRRPPGELRCGGSAGNSRNSLSG